MKATEVVNVNLQQGKDVFYVLWNRKALLGQNKICYNNKKFLLILSD